MGVVISGFPSPLFASDVYPEKQTSKRSKISKKEDVDKKMQRKPGLPATNMATSNLNDQQTRLFPNLLNTVKSKEEREKQTRTERVKCEFLRRSGRR